MKNDTTVEFHSAPKPEPKPIETKQEAAQKLGFNKQQVERFQTLAKNKDIVEQVKQEARAFIAFSSLFHRCISVAKSSLNSKVSQM